MKKLKMIVTSVIVLAIVGSAFAFNAKKANKFCTSVNLNSTSCSTITGSTLLKRVAGTGTVYYVVDWDGAGCTSGSAITCTTSAVFAND
jgi:hypothetical protein